MSAATTAGAGADAQTRAWRGSAYVAGLVALAFGLGVATLVAAIARVDGPVSAVGNRVVDLSPRWLKEWAIRTFGVDDKHVLLAGVVVVLVLAAAAIARLARRHLRTALAAAGAVGALGIAAATTRTGSRGTDWLPPLAGTLATMAAMWWELAVRPQPPPSGDAVATAATAVGSAAEANAVTAVGAASDAGTGAAGPATGEAMSGVNAVNPDSAVNGVSAVSRSQFLARAGVLGAGALAFGVAGRAIRSAHESTVVQRARDRTLPRPRSAAPKVPESASVGRGVEPYLSANESFYRIDTALSTPAIDPGAWRLAISGLVDNPFELTYDELLARPMVERIVTLTCVSNEVGGDLVGNARWLGVPLADLLHEARVRPGADQIASRSVDGWSCGFPTELALDGRDALVAVGMNGEPLPRSHGFPVRLVVPGLYGYVSATKWLTSIVLTTWDGFDGYWIPRGWAKEGPIKTQSRIDVPARGTKVPAGATVIAGVAWAQHRGVAKVEVQVDDGPWREAKLADEPTVDAWRQWWIDWDATTGRHQLRVRATDRSGTTQVETPTDVAPDGATGWHTVSATVV